MNSNLALLKKTPAPLPVHQPAEGRAPMESLREAFEGAAAAGDSSVAPIFEFQQVRAVVWFSIPGSARGLEPAPVHSAAPRSGAGCCGPPCPGENPR